MRAMETNKIKAVSSEFTRLLIQYWDLLGQPPLEEFIALIPFESALEHIEQAGRNEGEPMEHIHLNS